MDPRIAVLVSGAGSNLRALLEDSSTARGVGLVASDRPGAPALHLARERGLRTAVVDPARHASRSEADGRLAALLESHGIEVVVLAGYMRILGPRTVGAFRDRILNVHPSLLPAFPGAHAVRDALAWGAKVTGATVHLVDEEVDHGPIVLQEPVEVLPGDDERSLHERIKAVEHRLLPLAVSLLVQGRLKVEGRTVHILDEAGAP